MITVNDIYHHIDRLAPFTLAMDYDNCGLLIGSKKQEVSACVVALDITKEVLDFAIENKAQLIVTHHPIIFNPIKSITDQDVSFQLIQNNISAIAAHTNLDIAEGGVNDILANLFGLENIEVLDNSDGAARIGVLPGPITGKELAQRAKSVLNAKGVVLSNGDNTIKTVVVMGGAGSDYYTSAVDAKADAYLTGEIKHNTMIDSINDNITLIAAGHHYTEIPAMASLKSKLEQKFSSVKFLLYDNFLIEEI